MTLASLRKRIEAIAARQHKPGCWSCGAGKVIQGVRLRGVLVCKNCGRVCEGEWQA